MPWWIWLILSLFMLAMIVAGIAYAALHGFRALNGIAEIGSRLGKPLSELADVPQGADVRRSTSSGTGTRSANVTRVRGRGGHVSTVDGLRLQAAARPAASSHARRRIRESDGDGRL